MRLLYDIADADGAAATGTITVEVTPVDNPPHASDDTVTTHAGATEAIDVLANDTDDDNDPLTIVAVTPPTIGKVILTADTVTFHAPDRSRRPGYQLHVHDRRQQRRAEHKPPSPSPSSAPTRHPHRRQTPRRPRPTRPQRHAPTSRSSSEDAASIDIDVLANDTSADGDLTNDALTITGAPGRRHRRDRRPTAPLPTQPRRQRHRHRHLPVVHNW